MRKIIKNAIQCKLCGDIIESTDRHQYVTCKCGACAVDGGHDYLRRSFKDKDCYGNISPFEQCTRGDKRLKELLKLVARNREELDGTLTEKQKETLEKFEECMNEMHSITERDAFSYGFRLGVQLMAESFLQPMGEDENL